MYLGKVGTEYSGNSVLLTNQARCKVSMLWCPHLSKEDGYNPFSIGSV